MTSPMSMVKTGSRALQLISGVTKIVSNLSFRFSIFRALIIAGTAHANPLIMGITLLPFSPTLRISLSLKKLMRAIYPLSSSNVIKPKRIIICGIKTAMPPMPATSPFIIKSLHQASGNTLFSQLLAFVNTHSMASMG